MNRPAFCFGFLLCVATLATLGGCGDPRNRQEITGEVKLKGQPVEDGVINFAPLDGQPTGDGASIVKGKYQIPRSKGLSPGRYRVSIYAGIGVSGEGDASPDSPHAGMKIPKGGERVPPEYNEKSNVVRKVTKGGPNQFDFDIP
jgi:hypothetical protein